MCKQFFITTYFKKNCIIEKLPISVHKLKSRVKDNTIKDNLCKHCNSVREIYMDTFENQIKILTKD